MPKPDSSRRRRNVATSAATLPSQKTLRDHWKGRRLTKALQLAPRPDGEPWEERAIAWWREAVTSPMGTKYLPADLAGLYFAFVLIDEYYKLAKLPRETKGRLAQLGKLASEIRQQIARYGLTPRDRLSLHWGIAPDEDDAPATPRGTVTNMQDFRESLGQEPS